MTSALTAAAPWRYPPASPVLNAGVHLVGESVKPALSARCHGAAWLMPRMRFGGSRAFDCARNNDRIEELLERRRVGKGALASCPPLFRANENGGHASLCPPYASAIALPWLAQAEAG